MIQILGSCGGNKTNKRCMSVRPWFGRSASLDSFARSSSNSLRLRAICSSSSFLQAENESPGGTLVSISSSSAIFLFSSFLAGVAWPSLISLRLRCTVTAVPKAPTTAEVMNLASKMTPLPQFQTNEETRVGSDIFHRNAAQKTLEPHGESGRVELRCRFLPYTLVTEVVNPLHEIGSFVILLLLGARRPAGRPARYRQCHDGGSRKCCEDRRKRRLRRIGQGHS